MCVKVSTIEDVDHLELPPFMFTPFEDFVCIILGLSISVCQVAYFVLIFLLFACLLFLHLYDYNLFSSAKM